VVDNATHQTHEEISMDDPVWEDVIRIAATAASLISRKFHGYVDREDLQSMAVEHALRRQDKVREYLFREDKGERKSGEYALTTFLSRHIERKARAEKARKLGYNPEDEYFYRTTMIESLIKVWDSGDYDLAGQIFDPADMGGKRKTKLVSEGNDILAMVADMDRAMRSLDERTRSILLRRFSDDATLHVIADEMEISHQRVDQLVNSGLRKLNDYLGGRSPY
jgi:RNA polymerase sigma factor (sigma-70 family)